MITFSTICGINGTFYIKFENNLCIIKINECLVAKNLLTNVTKTNEHSNVTTFIHALSWTQLWYANDASAGGLLRDLREWFLLLCSHGPKFGYFPEPSKCFIVVSPSQQGLANDILEIWVSALSLDIDFWVALSGIQVIGRTL